MEASASATQRYQQEFGAVHDLLLQAAEELAMPLRGLVHDQIRRAMPLVRAAVILAAGLAETDTPELSRRRTFLAGALEMLYVALNIHKLLLTDLAASLDKSWMGSMILAGDYCFSRSASMAVQTDSPQVVDLFAKALKTVSEGNLRHLFGEHSQPYDENDELFRSGIIAAHVMSEQPSPDDATMAFASALAGRLTHGKPDSTQLLAAVHDLPVHQQDRWRRLLEWLETPDHNDSAATDNLGQPL